MREQSLNSNSKEGDIFFPQKRRYKMQKRMELKFGGGMSDVVYSLKERKLYNYEEDSQLLEAEYGGMQYYTSRSGNSGAGYLNFEQGENDLLKMSTYRSDVAHPGDFIYHGEESVYNDSEVETNENYIFIPTISHGGIDRNAPIIFVSKRYDYGQKIAFMRFHRDITGLLEAFKALEFTEMETEYYRSGDGHTKYHGYNIVKHTFKWKFHNENNFRGINALSFLNIQEMIEPPKQEEKFILQTLNLTSVEKTEVCLKTYKDVVTTAYLHRNYSGFYDQFITEDELLNSNGELVDSWQVGQGWKINKFFYKRFGNTIRMMKEVNLQDYSDGKYFIERKFMEYELDISIFDFYEAQHEDWNKELERQLLRKIRNEWVWERSEEKKTFISQNIKEVLEKNPNQVINLDDSVQTGNCPVGTREFINQFSLKKEMTFGELINSDHFEEFKKNRDFIKVIGSVVDREKISIH
jgi:hypothetical protein